MNKEPESGPAPEEGKETSPLESFLSSYPVTREGEPEHWNEPPPEVCRFWFITSSLALLLGLFPLFMIPFLATAILLWEGESLWGPFCCLVQILVLGGYFYGAKWWSLERYNFYGFAFTNENIHLKDGGFIKNVTSISYERIQDVNFTQGIFERRYGFYTVKIQTAGSRAAEGTITGVREPKKLCDFIMRQVRAASMGSASPALSGDQVPAPTALSSGSREILTELRELNSLLSEIAGHEARVQGDQDPKNKDTLGKPGQTFNHSTKVSERDSQEHEHSQPLEQG